MELTVRYLGGTKFEAEARGHRVLCDQPRANGGHDEGMTPPEFLLASLGTCAGYYAAQYLRTRSLTAGDLTVRVEAEKAAAPPRLASFRIEVSVPGLEERHVTGVLRAVKACLIHNTLLATPDIEVAVNPVTPAVSAGAPAAAREAVH
ncbi:MAG TPA: OsmC family protein [Bryobacteraceae bacterium]|nr:OsmC family protein [Bryobacteraceae bacterium]